MLELSVVLVSLQGNFSQANRTAASFLTYWQDASSSKGPKDPKETRSSEKILHQCHRDHAQTQNDLIVDLNSANRKKMQQLEALLDEDQHSQPLAIRSELHSNNEVVITMLLSSLTVVSYSIQGSPFGITDVSFTTALPNIKGVAKLAVRPEALGPAVLTENVAAIATQNPDHPLILVSAKHSKKQNDVPRVLTNAKSKDLSMTSSSLGKLGATEAIAWSAAHDVLVCMHRGTATISVLSVAGTKIASDPVAVHDLRSAGYNLGSKHTFVKLVWSRAHRHAFFLIVADQEAGNLSVDKFSYSSSGKSGSLHRKQIYVKSEPASATGSAAAPTKEPSKLTCAALDRRDTTLSLGFSDGTLINIDINIFKGRDGARTCLDFLNSPIHALAWHEAADMLCVCLATRIFFVDRAFSLLRFSAEPVVDSRDAKHYDTSLNLADFVTRRSVIGEHGIAWVQLPRPSSPEDPVHGLFVMFTHGPGVLIRINVAYEHLSNGVRAASIRSTMNTMTSVLIAREHIRAGLDSGPSGLQAGVLRALKLVDSLLGSGEPLAKLLSSAMSIYTIIGGYALSNGATDILSEALYQHPENSGFLEDVQDSDPSIQPIKERFHVLMRSCVGACIRSRNFVMAFRFATRVAGESPEISWRVYSMLGRACTAAGEDSIASVCRKREEKLRLEEEPIPGFSNLGTVDGDALVIQMRKLEEKYRSSEELDNDETLRLGMWWEANGKFADAARLYFSHGLHTDAKRAQRSDQVVHNEI